MQAKKYTCNLRYAFYINSKHRGSIGGCNFATFVLTAKYIPVYMFRYFSCQCIYT